MACNLQPQLPLPTCKTTLACITHVSDPWNFSARLGTPSQLRKFTEFDKTVNSYAWSYHGHGLTTGKHIANDLKLHSHVLARSELNAGGRWCRADVINIDVDEIDVLFIDYGLSEFVPSREIITKIPAHIIEHPRMIYSCRLAGVRPQDPSGMWSVEAVSYFSNLVLRKSLRADIVHRVTSGPWEVLLVLYIKTKSEGRKRDCGATELSVNQLLIENGHASISDDHEFGVLEAMTNKLTLSSQTQQRNGTQISTDNNRRLRGINVANRLPGYDKGLPPADTHFLKSSLFSSASGKAELTVGSPSRTGRNGDLSTDDFEYKAFKKLTGASDGFEMSFGTHLNEQIGKKPRRFVSESVAPRASLDPNAECLGIVHRKENNIAATTAIIGVAGRGRGRGRIELIDHDMRGDCVLSSRTLLKQPDTSNCNTRSNNFSSESLGARKKTNIAYQTDVTSMRATFVEFVRSPWMTDDEIVETLLAQLVELKLRQHRKGEALEMCLGVLAEVATESTNFFCSEEDRVDLFGLDKRAVNIIGAFQQEADFEDVVLGLVQLYVSEGESILEASMSDRLKAVSKFLGLVFVASRHWATVDLAVVDSIFTAAVERWMSNLLSTKSYPTRSLSLTSGEDIIEICDRVKEIQAAFLSIFIETVAQSSIAMLYETFGDALEKAKLIVVSSDGSVDGKKHLMNILLMVQSIKSSGLQHTPDGRTPVRHMDQLSDITSHRQSQEIICESGQEQHRSLQCNSKQSGVIANPTARCKEYSKSRVQALPTAPSAAGHALVADKSCQAADLSSVASSTQAAEARVSASVVAAGKILPLTATSEARHTFEMKNPCSYDYDDDDDDDYEDDISPRSAFGFPNRAAIPQGRGAGRSLSAFSPYEPPRPGRGATAVAAVRANSTSNGMLSVKNEFSANSGITCKDFMACGVSSPIVVSVKGEESDVFLSSDQSHSQSPAFPIAEILLGKKGSSEDEITNSSNSRSSSRGGLRKKHKAKKTVPLSIADFHRSADWFSGDDSERKLAAKQPEVESKFGLCNVCSFCGSQDHRTFQCPEREHRSLFV